MDFDEAEYSSELKFDNLLDKVLRIKCAYCKHSTNHKVLKSVEDKWSSDFGLQGKQDHLIVQCMGCDVISYLKQSSDDETYREVVDEHGNAKLVYTVTSEQYPAVNTTYKTPNYFASMPKEVTSTYHETHKALVHGLDKLGGAGIRMIVEMVCLSNGISKGKLNQKIDKLHEKGLVTEQMRDLLHNVRLFGNDQVHSSVTPDMLVLIEAWDAVNNFLASLYGTNDSNERFKFLKSK